MKNSLLSIWAGGHPDSCSGGRLKQRTNYRRIFAAFRED